MTWTLHNFEGLVVGKKDDGVGTLLISTAYRNECHSGATMEDLKKLALTFTGIEPSEIADEQSGEVDGRPFLVLTSHEKTTARMIWAISKQEGLILATYEPNDPTWKHEATQEASECHEMLFQKKF